MPPKATQTSGMPVPQSIVSKLLFTSPQQLQVHIITTTERDPYDQPMAAHEIAAFTATMAAVGDNFQGTARKAAKLSVASAPLETFNDLKDLLKSLPSDSTMASHKPPITTKSNSKRVAEEERNVQVRAFLYAASREADNDYHLILGRDPSVAPHQFMTAEISGLPLAGSSSFNALKDARGAYKAQFGHQLPGPTYDFYDPPMPVEVTGSLFFDMSHATGGQTPGPPSAKPGQLWEIHPITKITFEP